MNIFEKVVRRITRLSWNRTVHHIILEAMKRRIITSEQGHAILGAWNAECFPERGHASFLKGGRTQRALDEAPRGCEHKNMLHSEPHGFLYCPDCGLRQ